jgi:hypothetical protein
VGRELALPEVLLSLWPAQRLRRSHPTGSRILCMVDSTHASGCKEIISFLGCFEFCVTDTGVSLFIPPR